MDLLEQINQYIPVEKAVVFLQTKGLALVSNLIAALAIFVIGRWVARMVTRVIVRLLEKAKLDVTLVKFVSNMAYAGLLAFVIVAALGRLGVDTASFAAIIAAAGLAVGFALQGSLSNYAAGV